MVNNLIFKQGHYDLNIWSKKEMSNQQLNDAVKKMTDELVGNCNTNLYGDILALIEEPMLKVVMGHHAGNQSAAAIELGINRATLRTKLKRYDML